MLIVTEHTNNIFVTSDLYGALVKVENFETVEDFCEQSATIIKTSSLKFKICNARCGLIFVNTGLY